MGCSESQIGDSGNDLVDSKCLSKARKEHNLCVYSSFIEYMGFEFCNRKITMVTRRYCGFGISAGICLPF